MLFREVDFQCIVEWRSGGVMTNKKVLREYAPGRTFYMDEKTFYLGLEEQVTVVCHLCLFIQFLYEIAQSPSVAHIHLDAFGLRVESL